MVRVLRGGARHGVVADWRVPPVLCSLFRKKTQQVAFLTFNDVG